MNIVAVLWKMLILKFMMCNSMRSMKKNLGQIYSFLCRNILLRISKKFLPDCYKYRRKNFLPEN